MEGAYDSARNAGDAGNTGPRRSKPGAARWLCAQAEHELHGTVEVGGCLQGGDLPHRRLEADDEAEPRLRGDVREDAGDGGDDEEDRRDAREGGNLEEITNAFALQLETAEKMLKLTVVAWLISTVGRGKRILSLWRFSPHTFCLCDGFNYP